MDRTALRHILDGQYMSPEEADAAEVRLVEDPERIDERCRLVGYNWRHARMDPAHADDWCRHVLHLIRNNPLADFLALPHCAAPPNRTFPFKPIADAWLDQLESHPENLRLIENAVTFFEAFDWATADALHQRALAVSGNAPSWLLRQALVIQHRLASDELADHTAIAATIRGALPKLKTLASLPGSKDAREDQACVLATWARCAYAVGFVDESVGLAQAAIAAAMPARRPAKIDRCLREAHIVLGRAALAARDVESAVQHQREALQHVHDRISFIPGFELASDLLQKDKRQAVVEYLRECAVRWSEGRPVLDKWLREIHRGQVPSFRNVHRQLVECENQRSRDALDSYFKPWSGRS